MAKYSMDAEFTVKDPVDSSVISRLRAVADGGIVEAFSMKLRHPRFKARFTEPHFYARFRLQGLAYSEDAPTLDKLNAILEQDYLAEVAPSTM